MLLIKALFMKTREILKLLGILMLIG